MKWISLTAEKAGAPKRELSFGQLADDGVCCLGLPGEKEELSFFAGAMEAALSGGFFPYALTLEFLEDGKRFMLTQEAGKTAMFCDGMRCDEGLAKQKRTFLAESCVLQADLWRSALLGEQKALQTLYPMESAGRYLHQIEVYAVQTDDPKEKAFCKTALQIGAGENRRGEDFAAYLRRLALGNLAAQASKPLLFLTGGRYYFAAWDMEHYGQLADTHTGRMAKYAALDTQTLFYAAVSAALAKALSVNPPVFPYLLRAKSFEGKIKQKDAYRVRSYFYRLAKSAGAGS